jgi:TolA-binding protein
MAETVRRIRPLLVTARLRQRKYENTSSLLEEVLQDSQLDPVAADELAFWRGLCHLQNGDPSTARQAFADYYHGKFPGVDALPATAQRVRAGRRAETLLLQASCLLQENTPAAAAAFLSTHIPTLRHQKLIEAAGRATVLQLHALMEAGHEAEALTLVRETHPRLHEITQVVAFQVLSLQLGSRLLETGRPHDAILCLQRIWPRETILKHQIAAHNRFTSQLEKARKSPDEDALVFQLESLLKRLDREIDSFKTIENFDSALRFRVAAAYRDLGRHREAALVLDDMLARLPPDPVVEKAALSLIQCWMQTERWPRAVAAAEAYLAAFTRPDNPDVPVVRHLQASALHANHQSNAAELEFAGVHQRHPDHPLAPRALFMEGICLLEQNLNREALDAFAETAQRFPKSDVLEDCSYWSGMAMSFDGHHARARDQMRNHLTVYKESGIHTTEARFRIAFSTFGLAEYSDAIKELRAFLAAHRGHPLGEEAKLLLGDALGAIGSIDEAIAAYRTVDRSLNPKFYEEGVFRIGHAFKISEQPDAMRAHFEKFIADHPSSQRSAEAVYWIGQTHQQAGRDEAARQSYWHVILAHGDAAAARGMEDIFTALPQVYPGEEAKSVLMPRLGRLAAEARPSKPTLSLRARWTMARLLSRSAPETARSELLDSLPLLIPRLHHPRMIADYAEALHTAGRHDEARTLYLELRKWHPRATEKDRAFLGLARLALDSAAPDDTLKFCRRFEQESPDSPLLGQITQLKAQTLLLIGDLLTRQNQDLKSTAYYERVYVSYGKYRPEVAAAYWKRGEALDRLGRPEAALQVWQELATRSDLATLPETARAIEQLNTRCPHWRTQSVSPTPAPLPLPSGPDT